MDLFRPAPITGTARDSLSLDQTISKGSVHMADIFSDNKKDNTLISTNGYGFKEGPPSLGNSVEWIRTVGAYGYHLPRSHRDQSRHLRPDHRPPQPVA